MREIEPEITPPRVPVTTVLASIVGLWLCYFILTTVRAEILDLGFEAELLWRRVLVALIGVAATFAMWLILRLFDLKPLWMKVSAALIIAAPVSVVLAQANQMVFYEIEAKVVERLSDQQGLRVRWDESGNLLVDVPMPPAPPAPPEEVAAPPSPPESPAAPAAASVTVSDASVTVNASSPPETGLQQITEIALGRYFLMLAWCALYLALVAGEQARTAERREGAFRRAAKAAELRSLRYQVNPHFLFNTLNSLSALVLTGRNQQAEAMIQTISTFYRRSLADDPTADVPLAEEFALQRLYLDVEGVRFPERLVAVYDLPDDLADARVPGMILQPLVENSVKHAVASTSGKVTITLSAREEAGQLVITVADDGRGKPMPGRGHAGHGIGLANVRERLGARFGAEASIVSGSSVPSEASGASSGTGYATIIRIPLILSGQSHG